MALVSKVPVINLDSDPENPPSPRRQPRRRPQTQAEVIDLSDYEDHLENAVDNDVDNNPWNFGPRRNPSSIGRIVNIQPRQATQDWEQQISSRASIAPYSRVRQFQRQLKNLGSGQINPTATANNISFLSDTPAQGIFSPDRQFRSPSIESQRMDFYQDLGHFGEDFVTSLSTNKRTVADEGSFTSSYDEVLSAITEILPDICPDHVRKHYDKHRHRSTHFTLDEIVADILFDDKYPKRSKSIKRKRVDDEDGEGDDEHTKNLIDREIPGHHLQTVCKLLQYRFPDMPARFISQAVSMKKTIYRTLQHLKLEQRQSQTPASKYAALKQPRRGSAESDRIPDPDLKAQFQAAEQKISKDEEKEFLQKRKLEEDEEATRQAFVIGDIFECQCCCDDFPRKNMVVCDGDDPHAFCFGCLNREVKAKSEIQKHEITCMAMGDCTATFSRSSKLAALDKMTFERLERIQQHNELRECGIELSHCPFCDFAAECPPAEIDRELRCEGPGCGKTSCRLCQQESHVPLTCSEYKKEQGIDQRHQIEEEMTKALLRTCPKCKIPIIKEGGCNKITCSACHTCVCDVCGKDITKTGYNHFRRGACAQSDEQDGVQRAKQRVKAAEEAARQQVLAENPDLSAADLEIKVSEEIEKAEAAGPSNLDPLRGQAVRPAQLGRYEAQRVIEAERARHQRNMPVIYYNLGGVVDVEAGQPLQPRYQPLQQLTQQQQLHQQLIQQRQLIQQQLTQLRVPQPPPPRQPTQPQYQVSNTRTTNPQAVPEVFHDIGGFFPNDRDNGIGLRTPFGLGLAATAPAPEPATRPATVEVPKINETPRYGTFRDINNGGADWGGMPFFGSTQPRLFQDPPLAARVGFPPLDHFPPFPYMPLAPGPVGTQQQQHMNRAAGTPRQHEQVNAQTGPNAQIPMHQGLVVPDYVEQRLRARAINRPPLA